MSHVVTILLAGSLLITPPRAEAEGAEEPSLIQRGFSALLEGFWQENRPTLERLEEDMSTLALSLRPVLKDMAALVDDIRNYEMPERLENGDILIRRRADAPPPPTPEPRTPQQVPRDPSQPEISL